MNLVVVYDEGSVSPRRLDQLARKMGVTLIFVVANTVHARRMVPVLEFFGPVVSGPQRSWIEALRSFRPDGVITFSERQLRAASWLADLFGLPGQPVRLMDAITTKFAQRTRLREAGVDAVRIAIVSSENDASGALDTVGLPAIVKPNLGLSSRNTMLVRSEEEYWATVRRLLPREGILVVEEYLVGEVHPAPWGDYVAVDCLAQDKQVRPVFVTGKFQLVPPYREQGGYASPCLPVGVVEQSRATAVAAVRALGFETGMADVELKLTAQGPRVIEVNGRLGGWVDDLASRGGWFSPAEAAMSAALSQPVALPEPDHPTIAFNLAVIAPMDARRVTSLSAPESLRELPGVEHVGLRARPGMKLNWRDGTGGTTLATLSGVAADHRELAGTVVEANKLDWLELEVAL